MTDPTSVRVLHTVPPVVSAPLVKETVHDWTLLGIELFALDPEESQHHSTHTMLIITFRVSFCLPIQ